ncbi:hypothetical protein EJ07DRAFT_152574 [Lizonia empirigonia]|nr:hypothetical protein EJ07DRAFT_152574 [Lizonia empirigonia]
MDQFTPKSRGKRRFTCKWQEAEDGYKNPWINENVEVVLENHPTHRGTVRQSKGLRTVPGPSGTAVELELVYTAELGMFLPSEIVGCLSVSQGAVRPGPEVMSRYITINLQVIWRTLSIFHFLTATQLNLLFIGTYREQRHLLIDGAALCGHDRCASLRAQRLPLRRSPVSTANTGVLASSTATMPASYLAETIERTASVHPQSTTAEEESRHTSPDGANTSIRSYTPHRTRSISPHEELDNRGKPVLCHGPIHTCTGWVLRRGRQARYTASGELISCDDGSRCLSQSRARFMKAREPYFKLQRKIGTALCRSLFAETILTELLPRKLYPISGKDKREYWTFFSALIEARWRARLAKGLDAHASVPSEARSPAHEAMYSAQSVSLQSTQLTSGIGHGPSASRGASSHTQDTDQSQTYSGSSPPDQRASDIDSGIAPSPHTPPPVSDGVKDNTAAPPKDIQFAHWPLLSLARNPASKRPADYNVYSRR